VRSSVIALAVLFGRWLPKYWTPRNGLDSSWESALTRLRGSNYLFTYGPLGWLTAGTYVTRWEVLAAATVGTTICVWFATVLFEMFATGGSRWLAVAETGLVLALTRGFDIGIDLIPLGLAALLVRALDSPEVGPWLVSASVSCFCVYTKHSLGLVTVVLHLLTCGYSAFTVQGRHRKQRIVVACAPAALLCVYWARSGLRSTADIVLGYPSGMGRSHATQWPRYGVPVVVVLFAVVLFVGWQSSVSHRWMKVFTLLFCLAYAYQQSFTRSDEFHQPTWLIFASVVLCFTVVIFWTWSKPVLHVAVLVFLVTGIVTVSAFRSVSPFKTIDVSGMVSTDRDVARLFFTKDGEADRRRLAESLPALDGVDSNVLRDVVQGAGISVYPWDYTYILYAFKEPVPFRILQSYSAYTASLDQENSAWLLSRDSPQYLLYSRSAIDSRNFYAEAPRTVRSIGCQYRAVLATGSQILLEKTLDLEAQACMKTELALPAIGRCPPGTDLAVVLRRTAAPKLESLWRIVAARPAVLFGGALVPGRLTAASFDYPVLVRSAYVDRGSRQSRSVSVVRKVCAPFPAYL
jgi:hypothetical protein